MPQEVQIVPRYKHSHVETYINDYTSFNDEVLAPADDNFKFVSVFRSSQGIDNVFVKKTELSDFKKTYGKSDYAKYGQPLMMPIAMLSSGESTVYCMRVMPDDAMAANSILLMYYKFDDEETTTEPEEEDDEPTITRSANYGKLVIKYKTVSVTKAAINEAIGSTNSNTVPYASNKTLKSWLINYAETLRNDEADEDGFKVMPLAVFRISGRGVYGNNYRWRITRNLEYEKEYKTKMYSFEALTTVAGLTRIEEYVGSIVTSSYHNTITLINDIMDSQSAGTAVMDVQVFEENVRELYESWVSFVGNLDEDDQYDLPELEGFDPLFGKILGTDTTHGNIIVLAETESGDADRISVDRPTGTALDGGDDGAFGSETATDVTAAEIGCYTKAFNGTYDKIILSSRRLPVDVFLDANYPFEVKQVLATLANTRQSGLVILDAGVDTTLGDINSLIEKYSIFNTRNISKEFQHYYVRDYETKKRCAVTVTFFYASALPRHFKTYGTHVPFVKASAVLTGHIPNSLEPVIDDTSTDIKEKLYQARINYFEIIAEDIYQRCSQSTSQSDESDLMEESNMYVLFEIKRRLEYDIFNSLYDFTSSDDRARFTEIEQSLFNDWENRKVQSLEIRFDTSEWEAERSIIHCYVSVQFRNLMKRAIIEIDVNKRDFLA